MGSNFDSNSIFVLDLGWLTSLFSTILYLDNEQLQHQADIKEQREEREGIESNEEQVDQGEDRVREKPEQLILFHNGVGSWEFIESVLCEKMALLKKKEEQDRRREQEEMEREDREKEEGELRGEQEHEDDQEDDEERDDDDEEEQEEEEGHEQQQQREQQRLNLLKSLLQEFKIAFSPPSPPDPFFLSLYSSLLLAPKTSPINAPRSQEATSSPPLLPASLPPPSSFLSFPPPSFSSLQNPFVSRRGEGEGKSSFFWDAGGQKKEEQKEPKEREREAKDQAKRFSQNCGCVVVPSLFPASTPALNTLNPWFYKPVSAPILNQCPPQVYARIYIFPYIEVLLNFMNVFFFFFLLFTFLLSSRNAFFINCLLRF